MPSDNPTDFPSNRRLLRRTHVRAPSTCPLGASPGHSVPSRPSESTASTRAAIAVSATRTVIKPRVSRELAAGPGPPDAQAPKVAKGQRQDRPHSASLGKCTEGGCPDFDEVTARGPTSRQPRFVVRHLDASGIGTHLWTTTTCLCYSPRLSSLRKRPSKS